MIYKGSLALREEAFKAVLLEIANMEHDEKVRTCCKMQSLASEVLVKFGVLTEQEGQ